jgi:hypothetical protein
MMHSYFCNPLVVVFGPVGQSLIAVVDHDVQILVPLVIASKIAPLLLKWAAHNLPATHQKDIRHLVSNRIPTPAAQQ